MPPLRFQLLRTVCRLAFHLAAGCSALALVACLILWPLSYRRAMYLRYVTSGGSYYALAGGGGRLGVNYSHFSAGARPGFSWEHAPLDPGLLSNWSYTDWDRRKTRSRELGGFYYEYDYRACGCELVIDDSEPTLAIPFLYPTLLSALLPAFWLRGWVRHRRQARRRGFPVEPAAPAR